MFVLAIAVPASWCQARHSTHSHAKTKLAQAAEITFREGVHASLPPHISTLLGIAQEEACAVAQNVLRTSNQVQAFNVSLTDRHNIVLFVVDERTREQIFYLTSPEGALRRVVSVKAGEGRVVSVNDERKVSFQKEKQFWVNRLVSPGASM